MSPLTTGMLSRAWEAIHLGSTNQCPLDHPVCLHVLSPPVERQDFMETTTHTTSSAAEEDMTRCTTLHASGTEKENWYLLVITTSVGQLNLGPHECNGPKGSRAENTFQNLWMAATFPGSTKAISYEGTAVKELDE